MKCALMNKNEVILIAEYNNSFNLFENIYEIINIGHAPIIISNLYKTSGNILNALNDWYQSRNIPKERHDLDLLLARLNVYSITQLLDKAFGLSLSDQYWIKPFDTNIEYKSINFFENDFEYIDFTDATFSNSISSNIEINLSSPNNTTIGRLKKTWIIENGKRYLIKGGYKNEVMQPFNEVLATMICERLGFKHIPYTIDIVKDKVVSKCECFINKNTELVSAYQILHNNCDLDKAYQTYINILESNNISNAREEIENMFILDFLILNEDRHLNNFGIIRNVETLNWIETAPIFDNGQSLNILDYNDEEVIINGDGRFFYGVDTFDSIINYVKNLKRIDANKLDGIVEEFDDLLHKYQEATKMTDRRINKLCLLLSSRINKLKNLISEMN